MPQGQPARIQNAAYQRGVARGRGGGELTGSGGVWQAANVNIPFYHNNLTGKRPCFLPVGGTIVESAGQIVKLGVVTVQEHMLR